jgi:hypothetical protein
MRVNTLRAPVNFICAYIFEQNAQEIFNGSYGRELFCAIGDEVIITEQNVDLKSAQERLNKYIEDAEIISLRKFSVTYWTGEGASFDGYYYALKLNCVLKHWTFKGGCPEDILEVQKDHTFYFKVSSNYPKKGYSLEEDFNYERDAFNCPEWLTNEEMLYRVCGIDFNKSGMYYSMI